MYLSGIVFCTYFSESTLLEGAAGSTHRGAPIPRGQSFQKKRMAQRRVNLVDLDKRCKMIIELQKLVPIQPITSPLKFDGLAAKSEKDTVSYLSSCFN